MSFPHKPVEGLLREPQGLPTVPSSGPPFRQDLRVKMSHNLRDDFIHLNQADVLAETRTRSGTKRKHIPVMTARFSASPSSHHSGLNSEASCPKISLLL
jgi:hypothetical protein